MRLRQIEVLIAAAESGSLRAAARALNISQPAVSKLIGNLEREMQSELVRRTRYGIELTGLGQTFLRHARVGLAELRKAHEVVTRGSGTKSLAMGVGPIAAILFVPEAVKRVRAGHPQAELRVVEGFAPTLLPLVRDGTLDFAMGPKLPGDVDVGLVFRPLFREQPVVVCRRNHPLRHAKRLADLAEADWLAQWGRGIGPGSISRAFAAAGLPAPRQSVRCDSFNAMVSLIAQTDMVGVLSQRLLDAGRVPPQLAPLQLGDGPTAFTVGVFYRSRAPLSPLATAMVKAIVASVRQSEGRPAT